MPDLLCFGLQAICGIDIKVGEDELILHGKLINRLEELRCLQLLSVDSLSTLDSMVIDNNGALLLIVNLGIALLAPK